MVEGSKVGAMTRFVEVLATIGSFLLVLVTLPFSLCFTFKVVQEYERAVVFRMGRLKAGAYGPGKRRAISFPFRRINPHFPFFLLPRRFRDRCVDSLYRSWRNIYSRDISNEYRVRGTSAACKSIFPIGV